MGAPTGVDVETLAERTLDEKCTPFLGAGAAAGLLPTGQELAKRWIKDYQLPIPETSSLDYVAQMISVKWDAMKSKEVLAREIKSAVNSVDLNDYNSTYQILGRLNNPIYVTTNYDDLLERTLRANNKEPRTVICPWHKNLDPTDDQFPPTVHAPWVYHLHGYYEEPESMVLTEDDYTDFLVHVVRKETLHHRIELSLIHI